MVGTFLSEISHVFCSACGCINFTDIHLFISCSNLCVSIRMSFSDDVQVPQANILPHSSLSMHPTVFTCLDHHLADVMASSTLPHGLLFPPEPLCFFGCNSYKILELIRPHTFRKLLIPIRDRQLQPSSSTPVNRQL